MSPAIRQPTPRTATLTGRQAPPDPVTLMQARLTALGYHRALGADRPGGPEVVALAFGEEDGGGALACGVVLPGHEQHQTM